MAAISNRQSCKAYSRARRARDPRFDGLFFTAVKTTGIYCRPICPATPPKECNVEYHASSLSAAQSGFRPCLRCRPDSAPGSNLWIGNEVTVKRAIGLIDDGELQTGSVESLSSRLGVSSRYLRTLFQEHLGTSPKSYALHQQCLFAKQLLHQSNLSVTDIAFASGFRSIRRFNEVMQERLSLSPRQIRAGEAAQSGDGIVLRLSYRPPYDWDKLFSFMRARLIEGLEWMRPSKQGEYYGRTITFEDAHGYFEVRPIPEKFCMELTVNLDSLSVLKRVVQHVRLVFDLDAPMVTIEDHLKPVLGSEFEFCSGLRIPGVWSGFEAGVRAILGQQVSVKQAHKLVTLLVEQLGHPFDDANAAGKHFFPTPRDVANSDLDFFRMPQSRKDTLRRLANYMLSAPDPHNYGDWQNIKGIGPWTVNYVKLRAAKDPNVWLEGDAGIKNALKALKHELNLEQAEPWQSYLVFQLWNSLNNSFGEVQK